MAKPRNDKYKWFSVEGVIVGWLKSIDDGDAEMGAEESFEVDVAVVQTDSGLTYIRWLGNDWQQIDPPPFELDHHAIEQVAAIGTRIRFSTNWSEQLEYTKIARGQGGM